ncbi:MAG: hypothetical protein QRY71_06060 [Candidatus Rhabdochlamydia sp.]
MQSFSERLFFCAITVNKVRSLSTISQLQTPLKSAESIKEAENLINHQSYILKAKEVIRMYQLMHSDNIDHSLKEKLKQRFDENAKRSDAKFYADPKLDAYIEAHQGKIENTKAFNINNLANRARLGKLDAKTSAHIFQIIEDEMDELNRQVLEEKKTGLTGYEGLWDLEIHTGNGKFSSS